MSQPDPFIHLPHLSGRLISCEQSLLRMTPERLALWDQRAREAGLPQTWRLSEHEREATRHAVLGRLGRDEDLWVYAYGSLMWDPGIHFVEVRLARLEGYQRRFSYRITGGRGTPQQPALMLALEQLAGTCTGLVFRVPAPLAEHESVLLWRREMVRGGYAPRLCPVATPQGPVCALVFAANPAHPEHVGELPLDETAAVVASAAGPIGTNRNYLENLAAQLEILRIEDSYIQALHEQVRGLDRR